MAKYSKSEQEALRTASHSGLAEQLASNARAKGMKGLDAVRYAEAEVIRRHRGHEEQKAQAAELARMVSAGGFGLEAEQVAEYWRDYSRDFGAAWLELNPATMARFVGWLIDVLVKAAR